MNTRHCQRVAILFVRWWHHAKHVDNTTRWECLINQHYSSGSVLKIIGRGESGLKSGLIIMPCESGLRQSYVFFFLIILCLL